MSTCYEPASVPLHTMASNSGSVEDAFVNVMFEEERNGETVDKGSDSFYNKFVEKGEPLAAPNHWC